MIIKRMEICNFRQFKDKAVLDFSTDKKENVTVIMGDNGAGKTTLEQAFLWCLYGTTTFQVKEIINREVRDTMVSGSDAVVSVTLYIRHNHKDYQLTRKQNWERKTGRAMKRDDKFWVFEQDGHGEYVPLSSVRASAMVQEFLPEELAGFFFFDGERLEHMSDELLKHGKSSNFKGAVRGLVGLTAMMNAIEHLGQENRKRTVLGMINAEIDDQSNSSLEEYSVKINKLRTDIDNCKGKLEQIKPDYDRYQQDIGRTLNELQDMQNDIERRKSYDDCRTRIRLEEATREEDKKKLYRTFANNFGMYLLQPMLKQALEALKGADKLDKGIPYIHADTIKFLLERRTCICGTPLQKHSQTAKHLEELMHMLPPYNIGNMIGQYADRAKMQTRQSEDFYQNFIDIVNSYMRHDAIIDEKNDQMHMLEKKLPNQERVKALQNKITTARKAVRQLSQEIMTLSNEASGKEREADRLERERQELRLTSKRNRKNMRYLAYAQEVKRQLEEQYRVKEDEARQKLEDCINHIFESIYDGGIQIAVDEQYRVSTIVTDTDASSGDEIEKNTAQSYAIIFAFITGIIQLAKENRDIAGERTYAEDEGFPLVMDAPLSAFDKNRIQRICTELPHIADQVIIFIKDTDGELAERYMKNIIGKKWILKQETKTRSVIEERACS